MYLKLSDLNDANKDYQFNLSQLSEETWKNFVYDVVLINCDDKKAVKHIEAVVKIRDNKAKTLIGYQDDKYHELVMNLTPTGEVLSKNGGQITDAWRSIMASEFGSDYIQTIGTDEKEV